jgi:hypothetical protein
LMVLISDAKRHRERDINASTACLYVGSPFPYFRGAKSTGKQDV